MDRKSVTIANFPGLVLDGNKTGYSPGELVQNNNYLYLVGGGLAERGGGAKLCDAPAATRLYGLHNYVNGTNTAFMLAVQATKLYYLLSSTWVDAGITLTTNLPTVFEGAGFGVNRNAYGCNGVDAIIKVTTAVGVPAASFVANSPTACTSIKLHKNRLFAISGDTVYYTDANAFETWDTSANNFQVAPGVDGRLQALELWGDSLFFFKENGVYVLANAAEDPANWSVLKTDALIGTQSPGTVVRTKVGIYYLATDNRVRLISPNISFTSGEYVMGGSGSPIVSEDIQDYLDQNIDQTAKVYAVAAEFKDMYVLGFKTILNNAASNDQWFFADVAKQKRLEAVVTPQPYWGALTGFDFYHLETVFDGGTYKFYGSSCDGKVHSRFDDTLHSDSGVAIESAIQVGWFSPGGEQYHYRLNPLVVYADVESWGIDISLGAYKMGEFLQEEFTGQAYRLEGRQSGNSLGSFVLGTSTLSSIGTTSAKYQSYQRGNYFSFKISNNSVDQFTKIYRAIVYFEVLRSL